MEYLTRMLKRSIEVKEDPRLMPRHKKIIVVICVILAGTIPGLASTVYFPALPEITHDLHASSIGISSSTSLFILFQGFFPIIWSSLSDHFHVRRVLYMMSLSIFLLASLASCFVQSIWVLVFFRCVQSIGASASACLGAGTIADLYPVEKRGTAMGVMFFGVFVGPLIGPNIGGGLTFYWNWRATFYFCVFYSGLVLSLISFLTVETYRPVSFDIAPPSYVELSVVIEEGEEEEDGKEGKEEKETLRTKDLAISEEAESIIINNDDYTTTTDDVNNDKDKLIANPTTNGSSPSSSPSSLSTPTTFNPFRALFLLSFPFVALTSLSTGVAFGVMFTIETILPDLFYEAYHLNSLQIGLCYLGGGLGNMASSFLGGRYLDYELARKVKANGSAVPEDRFPITVFVAGFVIQPIGCLLFTWGVANKWHLIIPVGGFSLVCFGMTLVLLSGSTYLVDATGKGASATAAANSIRNLFACVLSLGASPMLQYVGSANILGVIMASLSILVTFSLLYNKRKGGEWRKKGGFAAAK